MKSSNKHKKITKASKHRLMTIGLICICIFIYFCFTVYSYSKKIIILKEEEKRLTAKLDDLKNEREDLVKEIEKLQDPEELAKYARETYHYSKDGEYVLKMETNREEIKKVETEIETTKDNLDILSNSYKYIIIIGSAFLTLLLTIHIIKNRVA